MIRRTGIARRGALVVSRVVWSAGGVINLISGLATGHPTGKVAITYDIPTKRRIGSAV